VRRVHAVARAARGFVGGATEGEASVVFAYHDVGDPETNTTRYLVSPHGFESQLRRTQEAGFTFVDLGEIVDRLRGRRSLTALAAVTFDDSLAGVHEHAAPILRRLGIPATVFTVAGALGQWPPWWRGAARVLTATELLALERQGIRVESHTVSHPSLPALSEQQVDHELRASRRMLEELLGRPVRYLAYPYGHYDVAVIAAARRAGYEAAFTFLNGRVTPDVDLFRIPRLNMWSGQGPVRLRYHLARPPESWPSHQLDHVSGPLGDEPAEDPAR
jgi:peptidoglycan/xylan/chitin deacetylase (PgdA/CDA1 family)